MATVEDEILDPRTREAALTIPVYGQLPFVPERASGCDIFTRDGRRILDLGDTASAEEVAARVAAQAAGLEVESVTTNVPLEHPASASFEKKSNNSMNCERGKDGRPARHRESRD